MFESIFEFVAPGAPALAPAAPQPPPLQDSLSSRLGNNEDLIEEVLKQGDLRMLCQLKGVSQGWRGLARGECSVSGCFQDASTSRSRLMQRRR